MHAARWYQDEANRALFAYFDKHGQGAGNPIIAMPTGTGKSFVIADILRTLFSAFEGWQPRVLMATHVKELIDQNYKELLNLWPEARHNVGIYSAGLKSKVLNMPVTFGGIGSLVRAIPELGHIDIMFIDECHLLGPSDDGMYMKLIAGLKARNPSLRIIGLTATPYRTGMGCLTNGPIFTDVIYDLCNIPSFKRLFAEGHLVPPRAVLTSSEYDMSNVSVTAGDFSKGELNKATANERITWAAIQESVAKGHGRNSRLVFCTGVEHAKLCNEMLKYLGFKSAVVHSLMSDGDRDDIIAAWKAGEVDTLTNNGICTTGINHPALDHIIMLRPTKSVGLWVQMLGRGTRPFEMDGWKKTDCLVTDHAGNARRLGTIDDPYIPKLKVKGDKPGDAPVKICSACGSYNHASARICLFCGEPFDIKAGYRKETYTDALVRSDIPIIETYKVDAVDYEQYLRRNAPFGHKPVLRVTYQCGLRSFREVVTLEAPGFGRVRAVSWWKQRFPGAHGAPDTVQEAMMYIDMIVPPKAIQVHINREFPEVTGYEY